MNILIIKTGALGDVLRTSFIAQALKDRYKRENPRIAWITSKISAPLFINNPYVDKVILADNKEKIRNELFDIVINLEEDEENCRFASNIKSRKKIGFLYQNGKIIPTESVKEWFNMSLLGKKPENDILKKRNKKTHRQLIGEIVGVNWEKYEPFLRLANNQRALREDFLKRYDIKKNDLIVGFNTGSADRWPKALPVRKTAKLIDMIYKMYKAKILLFGGPNEIERNKEIQKYTKSPVIDTGCGNDLIQFPALISACNLFITSDSFGLHVALALKRETICLVGPTSPAELGMYGIGMKVIAKSKDVCSYKTKTNCMNKIDLDEIMSGIDKLRNKKITLLITAFKEPMIGKAIEAALAQKTDYNYEIIVSAPDKETLDIAKKYSLKNKNLRVIQDPGKGKSFALNMIFKGLNSDILILTDGDVWISNNSVQEICDMFLDPEIGCLTGRPVPFENKGTKYGYWANFLFESAHSMRKRRYKENDFVECSGYLFAFRKKMIEEIPLDVAEDSVIPYFFWERGYKIGYAEKARVYVKNVDNWKDWIKQKTRTSKAHETLDKYVNTSITPRAKTFGNEAKGLVQALKYPDKLREMFWTFELILARAYMWLRVIYDTKMKAKNYSDAWERVESTK